MRIPPADPGVVPGGGPQRVRPHIAFAGKQRGPETLPALVDVVGAALAGDRRAEEDHVAPPAESMHEAGRGGSREVLGYLQADAEIKPAVDFERLLEVRDVIFLRPDLQQVRLGLAELTPTTLATPFLLKFFSHIPVPQPMSMTDLVCGSKDITMGTMTCAERSEPSIWARKNELS